MLNARQSFIVRSTAGGVETTAKVAMGAPNVEVLNETARAIGQQINPAMPLNEQQRIINKEMREHHCGRIED